MVDAKIRAQVVAGAGALAAIALAGVLVGVREQFGTTNVALLMALLVAGVAATGGRTPGAVTGIAAAISYNFFHTVPYRSLRVNDAKDIGTIVLLVLVGLVVGEVARRWQESRWDASRSRLGLDRVVRVAELAATGTATDELVAVVESEILRELRLAEVRFEIGGVPGEERPLLTHDGVLKQPALTFVDGEFAIPASGVDLAVDWADQQFGRLVLRPHRPTGVSLAQRRCAVALADQLGGALAVTPAA